MEKPKIIEDFFEEEEQDRREILPITAELLKNLYGSKQFYDALDLSVKELIKKKQEVGFVILKNMESDQIAVSKVQTSESSQYVKLDKVERDLLTGLAKKFPSSKFFQLGSFHFHPDLDMDPMPSVGDLESAASNREGVRVNNGYDVLPIGIVGTFGGDKKIKLFIHQEPQRYSPVDVKEVFTELKDSLKRAMGSQKECGELMQGEGYKVATIEMKSATFTEEDLNILSSFAFVPKPFKLEDEFT